jgi:hypothetical protein
MNQDPRLIVAAHIVSASAGHGDVRGFCCSHWSLLIAAIADDSAMIKALVRREHTYGGDWIKTTDTGGYFSAGDDPARVTCFDGWSDFQQVRMSHAEPRLRRTISDKRGDCLRIGENPGSSEVASIA